MKASVLRNTVAWLTAVALLVLVQWVTGAHLRDFDAASGDEATHFVTGIMIRDYLSSGLGTSPMAFAERFYVSYPRVGFGIWPPLFHLFEGVWFFLVPLSRWSALLLMAILNGTIALLLYREARRYFSSHWAWAVGVVFLLLPLTVETSSFLGADPAVSLLMFAATLAWTRYLVGWETRWSIAFGVLASLALLTKYNALSLTLLPLISIPLSGQWILFRRAATWLSAGIVISLAGPWYLWSWKLVKYAAEGVPPDRWAAFTGNIMAVVTALGISLLLTAAACVGRAFLHLDRLPSQTERSRHIWQISLFSLILSLVLFHSFAYPYVQERYLLSCLPAALLLSASGLRWILHSPSGGRLPAALAGVSMLLFLGASHSRQWDQYAGLREVGEAVSRGLRSIPGSRVLISSSASGEGSLIAEVAVRENRPYSFLLRGSKMLARSTMAGERYQLLYEDESRLRSALDALRVEYIVIDSFGKKPHDLLIQKAIPGATEEWSLVQSFQRIQPVTGRERRFWLYRRSAPFSRPARDFEVDLTYTLGRMVKAPILPAPISTLSFD